MITRILQRLREPRFESLTSLTTGALLVLAFSPFGIWPMAVLSLAAAFWLWQEHAPRRAFWLGGLFGLGAFGAGTYWLFALLHVSPGAVTAGNPAHGHPGLLPGAVSNAGSGTNTPAFPSISQ